MKIKDTVTKAVSIVKNNWSTPPKDRFMTYKEITSLSVGGIGVKFIVYCIGQMIISTGNALLANTIGIDPIPLYIIYIISLLSGFPLTALRASMIDNTRNMKGKYRPYILSMGIPTAILGIGFILMPYEHMSMFMKCTVVLAYNIGFQFFYNFFNDAYDSLINVLSPNSIERSDVLSIRSIVENLSPSIANIAFPLLAKMITGQNTLYNLKAYRVSFPPMLVAGLLISILVYANTEEKIVQAKSHFIGIKFSDAFRAVVHNKYFWIISLAGWVGFLEGAFANIIQWMYNYRGACSPAQYALIVAISGNASLWPNFAGPFLIRKWGKKKVLIYSNLLNIVFIAAMLPIVSNSSAPGIIWLLLVFIFINQFLTSLGFLMGPSINADIRDYQQYVTGERIDGMFAAVGLIGSVITMFTGMVLPVIYDKSGLNREVAISLGYSGSNVYDVLYNEEYFVRICSILVVASVIGAAMNVIPYFFYDLSETRQKAIVNVLRIKAFFEDYKDGDDFSEIYSIIRDARDYENRQTVNLKTVKDRKARKLVKEENEKIEISEFVRAELNRFNETCGKAELCFAKQIAAAGLNGVMRIEPPTKNEIKSLPRNTESEKDYIRQMKMLRSSILTSKKSIIKHYPEGIKEFDVSVIETLFAEEDRLNEEMRKIAQSDSSDRKTVFNELKIQKKTVGRKIRQAADENAIYHRAAKPYLDAVRLVKLAEDYEKIDVFMAEYEQNHQPC
ncbi:MAG: MFS transporter [Clostridia bacterium]|nr:MFS transporter [Clostridia bacterium]